jgi:hypothetical protein
MRARRILASIPNSWLVGSCAALACVAAIAADGASPDDTWCVPHGPTLDKVLAADNMLMLRPGWVTLRMQVHPGAVPVTDVRVVSEAGGPRHAQVQLPMVRQWVGCASNAREVRYDVQFAFGVQGNVQLPEQEGFGLYAFQVPQGSPALPNGDMGVGVCPIKARLQLNRPQFPNLVLTLESAGGAAVADWLKQLTPDRSYMEPNPGGNRVEFPCRVDRGVVSFYER